MGRRPSRRAASALLGAAIPAILGCGGYVETNDGGTGQETGGSSTSTGTTTFTAPPSGPACQPGDAPAVLAVGKQGPVALAIDEAFAYFWVSTGLSCTAAGVIGRVPKAGGTPEVLWKTMREVRAIAVDEASVYWIDSPDGECTPPAQAAFLLHVGPKDGGEPAAFPVPDGFPAALAMTLDEDRVYWAGGVQPVLSMTKDGASTEKFMTPGWPPSDVAVDAARVWVLDPNGLFVITKDPKGNPVTAFDPSGALQGMAMDDERIYAGGWGECDSDACTYEMGTIRAFAKDDLAQGGGAAFATLATRPDRRPVKVAVGATDVYWTERSSPQLQSGGALARAAKEDGGDVTMIADVPGPGDLAVDDACVYWVEETSGSVWRAPR